MNPVILERPTYRQTIRRLWLREPGRTCLTVLAGGLVALAVPVCSIGGFILGAYLAADLHALWKVVLGAVAAIGVGQVLSGVIWRRKPWERLANARIFRYGAQPTRTDGTAWALVPDEALPQAWDVLARAGLWTGGETATRLGAAPPDAPTLHNRIFITKADAMRVEEDQGAAQSAIVALRAAGIRARVDATDVP